MPQKKRGAIFVGGSLAQLASSHNFQKRARGRKGRRRQHRILGRGLELSTRCCCTRSHPQPAANPPKTGRNYTTALTNQATSSTSCHVISAGSNMPPARLRCQFGRTTNSLRTDRSLLSVFGPCRCSSELERSFSTCATRRSDLQSYCLW